MKPWSVSWLVGFALLAGFIFLLRKGRARQLAISAFGLLCCGTQLTNVASAAALLLFTLSGFVACRVIVATKGERARYRLMFGYLGALLVAFLVLKEYRFLAIIIPPGTITDHLSLVGLSYILFRQIQVVVDTAEGQIDRLSLWSYLNFQFNAFTFLAGPIQRSQEFEKCWDNTDPILRDSPAILLAALRLLFGLIKVMVIAEWVHRRIEGIQGASLSVHSLAGCLKFAELFYGYPLYLYLNFSGYCDIVIAAGSLVGIEIAENFNQPYLARNLIDYWARWHMTLTSWIRDYIFTPLYKLGALQGWANTPYWSYLCFFVSLFLAGVWHGSTSNYALFGAIHGFGIVATKLWEQRLLRRSNGRARFKQYMASPAIRAVSTFVTINYACFAMFFFADELGPRCLLLHHFFLG